MDAIYIVDVAYVLIASVCAGFTVYGGWLCLIDKRGKAEQTQGRVDSVLYT